MLRWSDVPVPLQPGCRSKHSGTLTKHLSTESILSQRDPNHVKTPNPGFAHFGPFTKSFDPGTHSFFRFIPKLLGSPDSDLNLMVKVKFPNFYFFATSKTVQPPKSGIALEFHFVPNFRDPSRKMRLEK